MFHDFPVYQIYLGAPAHLDINAHRGFVVAAAAQIFHRLVEEIVSVVITEPFCHRNAFRQELARQCLRFRQGCRLLHCLAGYRRDGGKRRVQDGLLPLIFLYIGHELRVQFHRGQRLRQLRGETARLLRGGADVVWRVEEGHICYTVFGEGTRVIDDDPERVLVAYCVGDGVFILDAVLVADDFHTGSVDGGHFLHHGGEGGCLGADVNDVGVVVFQFGDGVEDVLNPDRHLLHADEPQAVLADCVHMAAQDVGHGHVFAAVGQVRREDAAGRPDADDAVFDSRHGCILPVGLFDGDERKAGDSDKHALLKSYATQAAAFFQAKNGPPGIDAHYGGLPAYESVVRVICFWYSNEQYISVGTTGISLL